MTDDALVSASAEQLTEAIRAVWEAEWLVRDLALLLTRHDQETLRAIANEAGTSHRNIYRWANLAAHFPPKDRAPEYSVRTHSGWMRDDTEGRQRRKR